MLARPLALTLALAPLVGAALAPAPADAAPAEDDARKTAAASAVARAQEAFARGDYRAAIIGFTEANELRPAAKLDYNIGICHQRLHQRAIDRGDHEAETQHANAAIDAYNRYLKARPDAADRPEVEDLIRSLGGVPATSASLKPAPTTATSTATTPSESESDTDADDPDAGPRADDDDDDDDDNSDSVDDDDDSDSVDDPPKTAYVDPEPPIPLGSFAVSLGLWALPQVASNAAVEGATMGALVLRGGAFFGRRHRIFAGGGLSLGGGGKTQPEKLGLAAQGFDALVGIHLRPGGRAGRLAIPLTAIVGGGREALRTRGDLERPTCAVGSDTLVGKRWGGRLGGRIGAHVFFGAGRRHGLAFDLDVVATLYGAGPSADGCDPIFALVDMPRVRATVGFTVGYRARW